MIVRDINVLFQGFHKPTFPVNVRFSSITAFNQNSSLSIRKHLTHVEYTLLHQVTLLRLI